LVQAAALEAENRRFGNGSSRRAGRPKDVMTPFLATALLSVFLRCHNRAGRQSVVIGTTIDGKSQQGEAGELFWFIDTIIRPLNQYLTTELHRGSLSACGWLALRLMIAGAWRKRLSGVKQKPRRKKWPSP
jgi:hypothetical protein